MWSGFRRAKELYTSSGGRIPSRGFCRSQPLAQREGVGWCFKVGQAVFPFPGYRAFGDTKHPYKEWIVCLPVVVFGGKPSFAPNLSTAHGQMDGGVDCYSLGESTCVRGQGEGPSVAPALPHAVVLEVGRTFRPLLRTWPQFSRTHPPTPTQHNPTRVWLKLRTSLYEAQIGLGARLVSANPPPPPCASLAPTPPPAPRWRPPPPPPVRLISAKPLVHLVSANPPPPPPVRLVGTPPCASLVPTPPRVATRGCVTW